MCVNEPQFFIMIVLKRNCFAYLASSRYLLPVEKSNFQKIKSFGPLDCLETKGRTIN
jgi:hypothetical protein